MPDSLKTAWEQFVERMLTLARTDRELRSCVRQLAHCALELTDDGAVSLAEQESLSPFGDGLEAPREPFANGDDPAESDCAAPSHGLATEPRESDSEDFRPSVLAGLDLAKTLFRGSRPSAPAQAKWNGKSKASSTPTPAVALAIEPSAELELVARRCRLKAGVTKSLIEWAQNANTPAEDTPSFPVLSVELATEARRLENCRLWMHDTKTLAMADRQQLEMLAGCFEAAACAATLLNGLCERQSANKLFEKALQLCAEAQSALRAISLKLGQEAEADQLALFNWIKQAGADLHVFIPHYLKRDELAAPESWCEIVTRLHELGPCEAPPNTSKVAKNALSKLKYQLMLLRDCEGSGAVDWSPIQSTVQTLIDNGVPPSDVRLRELLLDVVPQFPTDLPLQPGLTLVVREIQRYLDSRPVSPHEAPIRHDTPEVEELAGMLAGKSMLLICGEHRPEHARTIKATFRLKDLIWESAAAHQSNDFFRPAIEREDVVLVVLNTGFASHSFGDIDSLCTKHGKPLVRLPHGYNVNQIAHQVLDQAGERLRKSAEQL